MRNQRNEETGRETRSNLSMLGREKEMASEEFEEESYLLMYQGSKHATNSNREEERWPRPVPHSFALLSLSLVFATGIRRRNRDEGRINESGRARVEADKFGRENGRLRWIDSTVTRIGRTSRRSPTREMVEITSRSIDWGSRKGRNGWLLVLL